MIIDFNDLIAIFDQKQWHIGVLPFDQYIFLCNMPIKLDMTNDIPIINKNDTVLIFIERTIDYDYNEINLIKQQLIKFFPDIDISFNQHVNLKLAAVLAGLGQYGKNTLFHDDKFGFDVHIALILIHNSILNLPEPAIPRFSFLPECTNCFDCLIACPVQALHINKMTNTSWVETITCDNFCMFGNHPTIPSIKQSHLQLQYPWLTKEEIKNIHNPQDLNSICGITHLNQFITIKGKKHFISTPVCRECSSQKKCSKYDGAYPYNLRIQDFNTKYNVKLKGE